MENYQKDSKVLSKTEAMLVLLTGTITKKILYVINTDEFVLK